VFCESVCAGERRGGAPAALKLTLMSPICTQVAALNTQRNAAAAARKELTDYHT
jgi:hypothetical protein